MEEKVGVKASVFKPTPFMEWAIEKKKGKWKSCPFCAVKPDPDCNKCGGEVEYFVPFSTAADAYRTEVSKLKIQWDKFHGVTK